MFGAAGNRQGAARVADHAGYQRQGIGHGSGTAGQVVGGLWGQRGGRRCARLRRIGRGGDIHAVLVLEYRDHGQFDRDGAILVHGQIGLANRLVALFRSQHGVKSRSDAGKDDFTLSVGGQAGDQGVGQQKLHLNACDRVVGSVQGGHTENRPGWRRGGQAGQQHHYDAQSPRLHHPGPSALYRCTTNHTRGGESLPIFRMLS